MKKQSASRLFHLGLALACGLVLAGCSHVGPTTVAMDRFDYSTAIGDSWKQQTLLNIVKLRYMDLPVFVDVASIVSGYSMETALTAGKTWPETSALGGSLLSLGGSSRFTDRPTITYVPMTGEKFLRGLITPIDPKSIFFMLQSGYAADFILSLSVESLNGVRNRATAGGIVREADPEFIRVLDLLSEVQAAGALGMRVEEDKVKGSTGVVFFRRDGGNADIAAKGAEIRQLLKLPAEQQKFTLTYSPMRGMDNELGVNSRSMLQIMQAFASRLDVPEAHLKDHSAWPALASDAAAESRRPAPRIHSGKEKPADAFAAVRYRGYWFWVDNGDLQTKRALTVVMFFFTLADTGSPEKLPLVTIPAQ
jgi:hypothetical protein